MSIVTKTGDEGMTGLFSGARVSKDSPRIHACGTVDELNAFLGVARAEGDVSQAIDQQLLNVQHTLFRLGGDLATPLDKASKQERIAAKHIEEMEQWIRDLETALPAQKAFLLPAGSKGSAHLHLARTVCRRAERYVVKLMKMEEINPSVRIYLNRLSDYLFLAARRANIDAGIDEVEVQY